MPHFFINTSDINKQENNILIKDSENYNHIVKSLRAKIGENLLFIDETETEYTAKVTEITKNQLTAEIISFNKSNRDLTYNLYLAQSPLRSDAQLTIVEKATELGIRGIYPIYTNNCALKKNVAEAKVSKWQKIMYEASKQCERANIPKCYNLTDLESIISDKKFDRIIALCERETSESLKTYLKNNPISKGENLLVIIGPEGGFSKNEFEIFRNKNLPMLSLGDLILKAETAVIVTLGNIIYEYGV